MTKITTSNILKKILSLLTVISIAFTCILGYLFCVRYKIDYNPEGRYDDGLVVYHEQAMELYGFLFLTSVVFNILLLIATRKIYKK